MDTVSQLVYRHAHGGRLSAPLVVLAVFGLLCLLLAIAGPDLTAAIPTHPAEPLLGPFRWWSIPGHLA